MGEDALWEGSSGGGGSEGGGETEGLSDWEVSLHLHKWGTGNWLLTDNNTSSLGKSLIDTSDAVIWGLEEKVVGEVSELHHLTAIGFFRSHSSPVFTRFYRVHP